MPRLLKPQWCRVNWRGREAFRWEVAGRELVVLPSVERRGWWVWAVRCAMTSRLAEHGVAPSLDRAQRAAEQACDIERAEVSAASTRRIAAGFGFGPLATPSNL